MMKDFKKSKRGTITFFLIFFFSSIILIIIAALVVPMGINFTTHTYAAGEEILNLTLEDLNSIQDATIRDEINQTIMTAMDSSQDNIEFLSGIYQYSWIVVLVLSALIVFVASRRQVEYGGGFII